ncbi:hypothetical protein [Bradyrhizobium sp. NP1]|uniref:hypothetical protein n=1 Tax=Bradyrhizobium sp. NP1 TaxID=3049772 RepID=UPI0025A6393A|nr:hypothetical protein [Bradyrhizobium sp. NP1]WJR78628.1 hypothetical protein QOU61_02080 [Bradyrhizobium sp. NP1]
MMQLHEPASKRSTDQFAVRPLRGVAAPRRFRLWLPLTPLLILLSPLLLLALFVAAFLPYPFGVNPTHVVIEGVRTLLALHGTRVEVQSPDALILINIF